MGKQRSTVKEQPQRGHVPVWTRGDRLRKARIEANITTIQLGEMLGVSRYTITNYEHDNTEPTPLQVWLWGQFTGVDPRWLDERVTEAFCAQMHRAIVTGGGLTATAGYSHGRVAA
jgi:transcriptional regulator with XRE-family HTH domain